MIQVQSTPNYAGIDIVGDIYDFDKLYESLHTVVGEEGEWEEFEGARLRVFGVCYDIRHAIMGGREVKFMDNGLDEDKMRFLSIVTSDKNVYLSCNILWPEIIFVMMALNDFIRLYARKQAKNNYNSFSDYRNIWDAAIATVRSFQAAIADCLKETIPSTSVNRILKLMNFDITWTDGYATQYIDELNCTFIDMDKEKRLKNITIMAKRLAEKGKDYQALYKALLDASMDYNCHITELHTGTEYPETIDW